MTEPDDLSMSNPALEATRGEMIRESISGVSNRRLGSCPTPVHIDHPLCCPVEPLSAQGIGNAEVGVLVFLTECVGCCENLLGIARHGEHFADCTWFYQKPHPHRTT